jgi:sec-independent protein translocase protein TatC
LETGGILVDRFSGHRIPFRKPLAGSMSSAAFSDPDDYFSSSRMSFGDHLEELRKHLIRAGIGFTACLIFSFFIGTYVLGIIKKPVETQLKAFNQNRIGEMSKKVENGNLTEDMVAANRPTPFFKFAFPREALIAALNGKSDDGAEFAWKGPAKGADSIEGELSKGDSKTKLVSPNDCVIVPVAIYDPLKMGLGMDESLREIRGENQLSTLSIQEPIMTYFKVCVVTGLVLGSPVIFWELWSFVAAGLYPHEKKYVFLYLPFSLGLFLGGILLCQFGVMPVAISALLSFNELIGLKPDLRLSEWLGFAIMMPLVFGISFQTPLVILFIDSIGLLDVQTIQSKRGVVWFAMVIIAAVITPSGDPFSLLMLWIPLGLLYELGIVMCKLRRRGTDLGIDVPDRDEVVGV